jgi:hypothetical protein
MQVSANHTLCVSEREARPTAEDVMRCESTWGMIFASTSASTFSTSPFWMDLSALIESRTSEESSLMNPSWVAGGRRNRSILLGAVTQHPRHHAGCARCAKKTEGSLIVFA